MPHKKSPWTRMPRTNTKPSAYIHCSVGGCPNRVDYGVVPYNPARQWCREHRPEDEGVPVFHENNGLIVNVKDAAAAVDLTGVAVMARGVYITPPMSRGKTQPDANHVDPVCTCVVCAREMKKKVELTCGTPCKLKLRPELLDSLEHDLLKEDEALRAKTALTPSEANRKGRIPERLSQVKHCRDKLERPEEQKEEQQQALEAADRDARADLANRLAAQAVPVDEPALSLVGAEAVLPLSPVGEGEAPAEEPAEGPEEEEAQGAVGPPEPVVVAEEVVLPQAAVREELDRMWQTAQVMQQTAHDLQQTAQVMQQTAQDLVRNMDRLRLHGL